MRWGATLLPALRGRAQVRGQGGPPTTPSPPIGRGGRFLCGACQVFRRVGVANRIEARGAPPHTWPAALPRSRGPDDFAGSLWRHPSVRDAGVRMARAGAGPARAGRGGVHGSGVPRETRVVASRSPRARRDIPAAHRRCELASRAEPPPWGGSARRRRPRALTRSGGRIFCLGCTRSVWYTVSHFTRARRATDSTGRILFSFHTPFFIIFFRWYSHHDPFSLQITAANLKTHSFYPDPAVRLSGMRDGGTVTTTARGDAATRGELDDRCAPPFPVRLPKLVPPSFPSRLCLGGWSATATCGGAP